MLIAGDAEMIAGFEFRQTVAVDGAMQLGEVLAVMIGCGMFVALVAHMQPLIMFNALIPVTLGVDVDLFGPLAIFNA